MSKATYPLKLPLSIKKPAQRLAKEDGVSLNQWIAVAVAEKVGVVETADPFAFSVPGEQRSPIGRWALYADGFVHAADRIVEGWAGQL